MVQRKPREIAARVLNRPPHPPLYTEEALAPFLPSLSPVDRRLCRELVCGVVRWQATLDWLIARKTGGRPQKEGLLTLLRLGLYQLFWLDRIPDHAVVNEIVELARQSGFGPQSGFVNAVLRNCAREREEIVPLLARLKTEDPAVGWSHPAWLYDRWMTRLGPESLQRLLEWNNRPPATFARVNRLKTDAARLLERWREEDVDYDFVRHDWLEENLVFELRTHPPILDLGTFRDGWFYVQDPSTLLAPRLLDPQPGETVLDLCAAPGGKSTFLAQLMGDRGRVVARDPQPDRLRRVVDNCNRLGIRCVEAEVSPARQKAPETEGGFDRVLVDAPCSNTGVLRRRVDLRWRLQPAEIGRLASLQRDLLAAAARHVRPGGGLVYSTCSLEPEENETQVSGFIACTPQFTLERERALTPWADGVDGAYVACLRRS